MTRTRLALITAAGALLAANASAQLPSSKVLTLDAAQAIAQEAMAKCRADGYKVTVLVVHDRGREDEGDGDDALQPAVRTRDAAASGTSRASRDNSRYDQRPGRCADQ